MKLQSHKHAILLVGIIVVALIESFSHRRFLGPLASDLAIAAIEMLMLLIVFERKKHRAVALVAFAAAVASALAHYVLPPSFPEAPLRLVYHTGLLLLLGFATIVMLQNIFHQRVVRSDDVLGGVCGYMLAAGAWAHLYTLIEVFIPGSFSLGQGFGLNLDSWHGRIAVMNYVSMGSLTSLGSGSVVPVLPPATVLTNIEAVFGQFYIAVVVAQLVGARLSQAPGRNSPTQI